MDNAIEVQGLSKSYGSVTALRDISFEVKKGELYGLIGPDGAGKTTLFRILTTLILPDSGTATLEGLDTVKDYKEIRKHIGYMPGRFSLYQDLTIRENLELFATVYGGTIEENIHLIRDIYAQIEKFNDRRAGKLSGGMKQKLALCCSLIHSPSVLFLDEPTTGVDPVSRREFWDILTRLKEDGLTIVVSTPYMDEASRCDRIALIQDGAFLQIDTPKKIIDSFPYELIGVRSNNMRHLLDDLRHIEAVETAFSFGEEMHITFKGNAVELDALRESLHERGHSNVQIRTIMPSIEDCFMNLSR